MGSVKRTVTVDEAKLRELWAKSNLSIVQIAAGLRVMEWDVVRAARRLKLPNRRAAMQLDNSQGPEPTQYEIEQRCREVRAKWTTSEFALRSVGRANRWRPPVVETFGKIQ